MQSLYLNQVHATNMPPSPRFIAPDQRMAQQNTSHGAQFQLCEMIGKSDW
jgi:hypothetical protein